MEIDLGHELALRGLGEQGEVVGPHRRRLRLLLRLAALFRRMAGAVALFCFAIYTSAPQHPQSESVEHAPRTPIIYDLPQSRSLVAGRV